MNLKNKPRMELSMAPALDAWLRQAAIQVGVPRSVLVRDLLACFARVAAAQSAGDRVAVLMTLPGLPDRQYPGRPT